MRILQVCPDSYVEAGGISVHVRNISERLARKHDVTVFATNDRAELPWFEVKKGVKVERFKCYAPNNAYFFTVEMPLRMRKSQFDVVHAHGYHAFPFHLSTLAKGKMFVATPHFHGAGHSPFRNALVRLLRSVGRMTLRKADRIIAVSEFERSLIRRQFGFSLDRVDVIPNGVDYGEFDGLKKRDRGFRSILYVGYLAGFKGSQYLVEVLPRLADDVVLEIVGRGPLEPFLQKRAHELNVSERVRFYHGLSRPELLQMYADADAFVLLSKYEAYSIVVAEALTAGTPCVVAKTSALSEWVDNEICFGVEFPISLTTLAGQINRALNSDLDRKAIRKWMGTKILDWNEVAQRLEAVYDAGVEA
jgi:glycosyltransferase involved in cell wall biosynthesis